MLNELTDLPQPLSPTQSDGLTFFDVVREAVYGLHYGVIAVEVGLEVFNFEERQFELSAFGSPIVLRMGCIRAGRTSSAGAPDRSLRYRLPI